MNILQPGLTKEHVKQIFVQLATFEVCYKCGFGEGGEAKQEGYVICLSDLFGQVDDNKFDTSAKSWIDVTQEIVGRLSIVDEMAKREDPFDYSYVRGQVETGVEAYLLENMDEAMSALHAI